MSKAEKFISDCTRNCSNELDSFQTKTGAWVDTYHEWLTPNQARRAVEITREEIYEWLKENAHKYSSVGLYTDAMITDLKQAMNDE